MTNVTCDYDKWLEFLISIGAHRETNDSYKKLIDFLALYNARHIACTCTVMFEYEQDATVFKLRHGL